MGEREFMNWLHYRSEPPLALIRTPGRQTPLPCHVFLLLRLEVGLPDRCRAHGGLQRCTDLRPSLSAALPPAAKLKRHMKAPSLSGTRQIASGAPRDIIHCSS